MHSVIPFRYSATLIKTVILTSCFVFITSCTSKVDDTKVEGESNVISQLEDLLKQAESTEGRAEKLALAKFAARTHAQANELAEQQQAELALGFYQAASQAYWRDDISANNASIFEIAGKVEQICAQLGDAAPSKDCFVSPLIEHYASVDMITFNPELTLPKTSVSEAMAARARSLAFELGKSSSNNIGVTNGALTNLMAYVLAHQTILDNHADLKDYVCSNLASVFEKYVFALRALEDYYANINDSEHSKQLVGLENEHPLFQAYKQSVDTQQTLSIRSKSFIHAQVPSCAYEQ